MFSKLQATLSHKNIVKLFTANRSSFSRPTRFFSLSFSLIHFRRFLIPNLQTNRESRLHRKPYQNSAKVNHWQNEAPFTSCEKRNYVLRSLLELVIPKLVTTTPQPIYSRQARDATFIYSILKSLTAIRVSSHTIDFNFISSVRRLSTLIRLFKLNPSTFRRRDDSPLKCTIHVCGDTITSDVPTCRVDATFYTAALKEIFKRFSKHVNNTKFRILPDKHKFLREKGRMRVVRGDALCR